jgi:Flp pilus assembly pilin Flp
MTTSPLPHFSARRPSFTPLTARSARRLFTDESGAATAEYAIATMAAVAFAGLLVVIMRSDEVRGILTDLIRRALTVE